MQRPKASRVSIVDDAGIVETFATSIVDVSLISNGSISVTFGTVRNIREDFEADPKRTVCVTNRVVLSQDAAQSLAHLLARMLTRAKEVAAHRSEDPGEDGGPASQGGRLS